MKTYKLPFKVDYVKKYQIKDADDNVILEFMADKKFFAEDYVNYINNKFKNKIEVTVEMESTNQEKIQNLNNKVYI